ncbi:MAG: hypothetical protein H7Y38_02000 [Armatimonadetes bacterium]|nr:hypothetical protein [Armatimonadota bacterium]
MRNFRLALAVGLLTTGVAHAQVDANLGTVLSGSPVAISGTTVGATNDIDTYTTGNATAIWDQDFIYEFNVATPGSLFLDTNDVGGNPIDNDFFLLSSLATTVNASGLRQAEAIPAIGNFGQVGSDGSWNILSAGTYYLAIDAWRGIPANATTPATGRAGAFNGSLTFTAVGSQPPPPPSTAAFLSAGGSVTGTLAASTVVWQSFVYSGIGGFSLNTDGSGFDTELGLYNSNGQLVVTDDDSGLGTASLINAPANLAAGTYYLALGGFDTGFAAANFAVTPGAAGGAYRINGIAVPEATTPLLIGLGMLAGTLVHVRKRRSN